VDALVRAPGAEACHTFSNYEHRRINCFDGAVAVNHRSLFLVNDAIAKVDKFLKLLERTGTKTNAS
jgi:hypothetical protein